MFLDLSFRLSTIVYLSQVCSLTDHPCQLRMLLLPLMSPLHAPWLLLSSTHALLSPMSIAHILLLLFYTLSVIYFVECTRSLFFLIDRTRSLISIFECAQTLISCRLCAFRPSYSLMRTHQGRDLMTSFEPNIHLCKDFSISNFITPTWDILEGSSAERLSICTETNLGRGSGEKDSYGVSTCSEIFKS